MKTELSSSVQNTLPSGFLEFCGPCPLTIGRGKHVGKIQSSGLGSVLNSQGPQEGKEDEVTSSPPPSLPWSDQEGSYYFSSPLGMEDLPSLILNMQQCPDHV